MIPQPPQLLRSNAVFTHAPLQLVSPMLHVQTPFTQPVVAMEPLHTFMHMPQLLRSFCRSRQMPLQFA